MARGGSAWPWILVLLAIVLAIAVAAVGIMSTISDLDLSGGGERRIVRDDEEDPQGVFVEIPVEGVISDSWAGGPNPVAWVRSCLAKAEKEKNLSGILLRVNSPGGGIRASDVILEMLREFKADHDVPIVVWMKDVAASGGYYVSMASDWIVAHDDTITGSIGVIWPTMNWRELTQEKLGIVMGNVKSAPMKDIGSPNRDMTPAEHAVIQEFVDDAFAKFVSIVVAGRTGKGDVAVTDASVRALESRIISGRRAKDVGLVDQLGYRKDAVAKLKELAGIERADVIEYGRPKALLQILMGAKATETPLERRLRSIEYLYAEGPALLALWER